MNRNNKMTKRIIKGIVSEVYRLYFLNARNKLGIQFFERVNVFHWNLFWTKKAICKDTLVI